MALLHNLWPRRDFNLPEFELAPLEFETEAGGVVDELLLDEVIASIGPELQVEPTFQAMPTAGDLQASIECHLRAVQDSAPSVDAADELRDALSELRRSIG